VVSRVEDSVTQDTSVLVLSLLSSFFGRELNLLILFESVVVTPNSFVHFVSTSHECQLKYIIISVMSFEPVFCFVAGLATEAGFRRDLDAVIKARLLDKIKDFVNIDDLFFNIHDIAALSFREVDEPAAFLFVAVAAIVYDKFGSFLLNCICDRF